MLPLLREQRRSPEVPHESCNSPCLVCLRGSAVGCHRRLRAYPLQLRRHPRRSAGAHLGRRRHGLARARRPARNRRQPRCRCSPATGSAPRTAASRSSSATARPCTSIRSSTVDFQSDEVIRLLEGRRAPDDSRAAPSGVLPDRRAGRVGRRFSEPGEYRVARASSQTAGAAARSSWWSCAARRTCSTKTGRPPCAPASGRSPGRDGARPTPTSTTPRPGMPSTAGPTSRRSRARRRSPPSTCPETVAAYSSTFDRYGVLAARPVLRLRLVSDGQRRLAPLLLRPLGELSRRSAGPGSARTPGPGRRTTTGAGVSPPAPWFWIPGRTWGPAWVSWAYAPGYVSWCPLGWDNRAGLAFGRADTTAGATTRWHAWTVVPHQRFGHGYVNANVVGGARIDVARASAFVVRPTAPDYPGRRTPCRATLRRSTRSGSRRGPGTGVVAARCGAQRRYDVRRRGSIGSAPSDAARRCRRRCRRGVPQPAPVVGAARSVKVIRPRPGAAGIGRRDRTHGGATPRATRSRRQHWRAGPSRRGAAQPGTPDRTAGRREAAGRAWLQAHALASQAEPGRASTSRMLSSVPDATHRRPLVPATRLPRVTGRRARVAVPAAERRLPARSRGRRPTRDRRRPTARTGAVTDPQV